MECNKDEAMRALSIAEGRLEKNDLAGANKFALKAQALYPGLGGISQMLTTLNVLVVGENKISGEVDWYSVLSINPSADDETIRKQYRKLALVIHPDKNKSVGADGAFKLILEAWSLLSDKAKRLEYNQRRGFPSAPPPPPRTNAGDNYTSRTTSETTPPVYTSKSTNQVPRQQQQPAPNQTHVPGQTQNPRPTQNSGPTPSGVGSVPSPNFQQVPHFGNTNVTNNLDPFQLILEVLHSLLANNIQWGSSVFHQELWSRIANAYAPPPPRTNQVPQQQHQAPNGNHVPGTTQKPRSTQKPESAEKLRPVPNSVPSQNFQKVPLSDKTNVASNLDAFTAAKLKRMHTESKPSAASLEEHMKRRKLDKDSYGQGKNHNMAQGNGVSGHGSRVYNSSGTKRESSNATRDSGARDRPRY